MRLTFSFHVLRDGPKQITGSLFRDDFRCEIRDASSQHVRFLDEKCTIFLTNSYSLRSYWIGGLPIEFESKNDCESRRDCFPNLRGAEKK